MPQTDSFRPKYVYSIVSVAIALFMLGLFGITILYGVKLIDYSREHVNIIVELRHDTRPATINQIMTALKSNDHVKPQSVRYLDKQQAFEMMTDEFGEEIDQLHIDNPLFDIIIFNLNAPELNQQTVEVMKKTVLADPAIHAVHYELDLINQINKNIANLTWIAVLLSFMMLFVAVMLIYYTIKLVTYGDRWLIKNMELVGASWQYIRRPYVWRGIINGIWSGILAVGALVGVLYMVNKNVPELKSIQDFRSFVTIMIVLVFIGIIVSGVATRFAVQNYLKKRAYDL